MEGAAMQKVDTTEQMREAEQAGSGKIDTQLRQLLTSYTEGAAQKIVEKGVTGLDAWRKLLFRYNAEKDETGLLKSSKNLTRK